MKTAVCDLVASLFAIPSCLSRHKSVFILLLAPVLSFGQTGPGGVGNTSGTSDLTLWLDAGQGVSVNPINNVTSWSDLSGYGNDASAGTNAPSFSSTGGGNGQPSIFFDETNSENLIVTGNSEVLPATSLSVFVAASFDDASDDYASLINTASDNNWTDGWGIDGEFGGLFFWTDWNTNNAGDGWCGNVIDDEVNHIYGLSLSQDRSEYIGSQSESFCNISNTTLSYDDGTAGNNVLIGAGPDDDGAAYYMRGNIEEVILFDAAVNEAQRIIITNYLSAKYDIALDANDLYVQDNGTNGDYDFDVAGIGRIDASNIHNDAQGSGIVRMLNPSGLQNDEFLLWGHDNGALTSTETVDVPSGIVARLERVWRVSEVRTNGAPANVGNVDIRFDLTGIEPDQVSDLKLLVDTNNNGSFDENPSSVDATSLGGGVYEFAGVNSIANNRRFTLGTASTILPIELIHFSATSVENGRKVELTWATATEKNNEAFSVERSMDSRHWETLFDLPGAGDSDARIDYIAYDPHPIYGTAYYRLKQTDFDGTFTYSGIVHIELGNHFEPNLYPNPARDLLTVQGVNFYGQEVRIFDVAGKDVSHQVGLPIDKQHEHIALDISSLSPGIYTILMADSSLKFVKKP